MPPVRPALYVVILDSGCNRIPDRCFAPGPLLPSKTGLLLVSASAWAQARTAFMQLSSWATVAAQPDLMDVA